MAWKPSTSRRLSSVTRPLGRAPSPRCSCCSSKRETGGRENEPSISLVTSQLVLDEASLGDPTAAAERLKLLADIPLIPTDWRVETVANELVARSLIPAKARLDALHVALAAVGAAQFLLTQNCRHIANAHTLPSVYRALEELGYPGLLIYTPAEFLGGIEDES